MSKWTYILPLNGSTPAVFALGQFAPAKKVYPVKSVASGYMLSVLACLTQTLSTSEETWCCNHCHKMAFPFHDCSTILNGSTDDSLCLPSIQTEMQVTSLPLWYHLVGVPSTTQVVAACPLNLTTCKPLQLQLHPLSYSSLWDMARQISTCFQLFIPDYHILRHVRNCHGGTLLLYILIPLTCLHCHTTLEMLLNWDSNKAPYSLSYIIVFHHLLLLLTT